MLEKPLLRRYHDQLQAHGVDGYSWDQLWTDYRLMIPMGVYIAVEYSRGGLHTDHAVRLAALPAAHAHRLRRPGLLRTLVNASASADWKVSTAAKYSSNRATQRVLDCAPVTVPAPMRSADASARSSHRRGHWFEPSIAHQQHP